MKLRDPEHPPAPGADPENAAAAGTTHPHPQPAPARRAACIVGDVAVRQGDGASFNIRKGPCTVVLTALDATIDWRDGDSRGLAALSLKDFNTHLASGALVFSGKA